MGLSEFTRGGAASMRPQPKGARKSPGNAVTTRLGWTIGIALACALIESAPPTGRDVAQGKIG